MNGNPSTLRIVVCAFLCPEYLDEAHLCIESIRSLGKFTGRIDMLTDLDIAIKMKDVHYHVVPNVGSATQAAGYRLRMLDVLDWNNGDIFMYVDTDVLCMHDMSAFIHHADSIDTKLHVYGYKDNALPRRTQKEGSFAGHLTKDPLITNQVGWCTGILLFRPSSTIQTFFQKALDAYQTCIASKKVSSVWEQPALCLVFCQHRYYETSLDPFVMEQRYYIPKHKKLAKPPGSHAVFNHYCGLRGAERKTMMRTELDRLLATTSHDPSSS